MTNAPAVGAGAVRLGRSTSVASMGRRGWSVGSAFVAALLLAAIAWLAVGMPAVAAPNSLELSATYHVRAHIYWSRGSMLVSSTARVTNTTSKPVTRLTFNLVPLVTGDARLLAVSVGATHVDVQPKGQTIVVPLPDPLASGGRTRVTIRYRAHFNAIAGSRQFLLGANDGVITAYRWIPWLSRRQAFAAPNFGETWVTGVSPHVAVTLTSSKPLIYATSGRRTAKKVHSQTFSAENVRDFNFSASPDYKVRRLAWNDVAVRIYYRTGSGEALAVYAVEALQRFTDKVGPYPYDRLNIAEAPIDTGMESPALAWVSSTASPQSLRALVTHEVAHQWFYGVVGNNQARQPFLDEALAEFLTRNLLRSFPSSRCAIARLDMSVYEYTAACYADVVYNQGSRYLEKYQSEVGNRDFWAGVSQFYSAYKFQIAGTRAFLDYLDAASGFDSQRHAERFPSLYP